MAYVVRRQCRQDECKGCDDGRTSRSRFAARRPRTLVVVGDSGAGKSTLIRSILVLEKPNSGRLGSDGVGAADIFVTPYLIE